MKSNYIIILLAILLIGCGPAYHLKRMKYHERIAYAKGADISKDTVFITKEVIMPGVKTDTVFESKPGDTIYISKERLRIKYVNLLGDSVFIEGECKDSVITITEPVYINNTIKTTTNKVPWWVYVALGFSAVVIGALLFRR